MRPHAFLLAAMFTLGALAPRPAAATSMVLLSDVEHTQAATVVVRATVGDQVVRLEVDTKRPMTHTQLHVSEVLYGSAPTTVELVQVGGEYQGEGLFISGDGRLKPGEDVVVFLTERRGVWMLTSMEQSKYAVEVSLDGPVLHRELTSGFFLRGPQGSLKQLDDLHDPDVRLEDMKKLLKDLDGGAR